MRQLVPDALYRLNTAKGDRELVRIMEVMRRDLRLQNMVATLVDTLGRTQRNGRKLPQLPASHNGRAHDFRVGPRTFTRKYQPVTPSTHQLIHEVNSLLKSKGVDLFALQRTDRLVSAAGEVLPAKPRKSAGPRSFLVWQPPSKVVSRQGKSW